MPLYANNALVEDAYRTIPDDAPIPDNIPVLVTGARFLSNAADFARRRSPTGVLWANDRNVAVLAPHLDRLALIALNFPNFRDGRAYSQARILRERYGYCGQLRATGEVLLDQVLFMLRTGFDSFALAKEGDAARFDAAVRRYSVFYQPGERGRSPVAQLRLRTLRGRDERSMPIPAEA